MEIPFWIRVALPLSYLLWGFISVGLRVYIHWRRTGTTGFAIGDTETPHGYQERMLFVYTLILSAYMLLVAFEPDFLLTYAPYFYQATWSELVGIGLILFSAVICFVAQINMKESWRIGLDTSSNDPLVHNGLYRFSRNPIYLTIFIALAGLFLTMPNWISLSLGLACVPTIQTQVRLEEQFLLSKHGDKYREFCRRVRRWI
jgi:protein-S-isoprenylcysteine O-methyltransferase Ste14